MPGVKVFRIFLMVLLPALFLLGVAHLFQLRFETGDVYPVYSSLRSDPLGTRVFFEALNRLPDVTAERGYRSPSKIESGAGATYFFPGDQLEGRKSLRFSEVSVLEQIARTGGRVVLAFHPEKIPSKPKRRRRARKPKPRTDPDTDIPTVRRKKNDGVAAAGVITTIAIHSWKRLGIVFIYSEKFSREPAVLADSGYKGSLPPFIPLRTAVSFETSGTDWKPIYTVEGRPVLVERSFGRGTLVLSADTYFMSNEAMRKDRRPQLLAWLMGPNVRAVFDETHLGIQESPGITHLARKYNIHGLIWGILLLAGLFVWKNSSPFAPPPADPEAEEDADENRITSRRDYTEGLVNLLRRHIPRENLLRACRDEWEKSAATHGSLSAESMAETRLRIQESLSSGRAESDPVTEYRRIHQFLSEADPLSGKGQKEKPNG